ncbi:MAG: prolipoprotein diacylglyceryl transferase [Chloroflexota bacterium]
MPAILHLLTISIGMDPNIAKFGSLQLTWHGIFTAVGIAAGVYLGAWLGRRQGVTEDDAYSIALVGVPAGIIGARAMYVLENRARFEGQWLDVLRINEGGISIYGAVIGGVLGAVAYGWIRKLPITRGLDAAAFGLLLGMGIGRIGDLINGEHVAKASSLPWATEYTNPASPAFTYGPTHPATTYEMIGDFLIIGIMVFLFIQFWKYRPGITFFAGLVLYSAMRFGVSYLRIDSGVNCPNSVGCPDHIIKNWMSFPQVVSTCTWAIGMVGLAWTIVRKPQEAPTPALSTATPAGSKAASARS